MFFLCCLTAVWLWSNPTKDAASLKTYIWKALLSLGTDTEVKVVLSLLNTTNPPVTRVTLNCTYRPKDCNSSSSRQVEVVLLWREAEGVSAKGSGGVWATASSSEKSIRV